MLLKSRKKSLALLAHDNDAISRSPFQKEIWYNYMLQIEACYVKEYGCDFLDFFGFSDQPLFKKVVVDEEKFRTILGQLKHIMTIPALLHAEFVLEVDYEFTEAAFAWFEACLHQCEQSRKPLYVSVADHNFDKKRDELMYWQSRIRP